MSNINTLNQHLFAQMDRLSADNITPEQIEDEAKRAKALVSLADQIVNAASLQMKAAVAVTMHGDRCRAMMPAAIEDKSGDI